MGDDELGERIAMREADRHGNPPLRGDADPEGAGVLHDLADRIAKISLTFNPEE